VSDEDDRRMRCGAPCAGYIEGNHRHVRPITLVEGITTVVVLTSVSLTVHESARVRVSTCELNDVGGENVRFDILDSRDRFAPRSSLTEYCSNCSSLLSISSVAYSFTVTNDMNFIDIIYL
jgi:hypothetical protein